MWLRRGVPPQSSPLFTDHARKAGPAPPARTAAASRERNGDIRAWAKDHGTCGQRPRTHPASVVEQYQAATQGPDHAQHGPANPAPHPMSVALVGSPACGWPSPPSIDDKPTRICRNEGIARAHAYALAHIVTHCSVKGRCFRNDLRRVVQPASRAPGEQVARPRPTPRDPWSPTSEHLSQVFGRRSVEGARSTFAGGVLTSHFGVARPVAYVGRALAQRVVAVGRS